MVDRQNLPRPAPEITEAGVPAIEEIPEDVLRTGDPLDGELPPLDRPQGVTGWGTTASEQLRDEPLAVRLRREVPEVGPDDIDTDDADLDDTVIEDRQFLEPGGESGLSDDEADLVGEADAGLEDTLSAEEAAMRVVDEPGGMNYDPDPGYLDHS
ncbi:MAG: hypothetical protein M3Y04_05555 [Actinomycetota bacterium]|nr:hypothetical protein [Actinomycetota bacterium]